MLTLLMLTGCASVFGGGLGAIERQQEVMTGGARSEPSWLIMTRNHYTVLEGGLSSSPSERLACWASSFVSS
jgi:hypothetical protein